MVRSRKYLAAGSALLLLIGACWIWSRVGPRTPKLSVVFVGFTNNPTRAMTPTRVEVCGGATGLCAVFQVANTSSNKFIWFKAASAERMTGTGWQPFIRSGATWSGVEGSVWQPGYSCLYAVGWPPGLSTNTAWRLQVDYGTELSRFAQNIEHHLGRRIFKRGRREATVPSSEVSR